MKQHPFRLRLPHRLVSSVQFRFAVTFTILVAILLALMNTYPTRASRDIVFTEIATLPCPSINRKISEQIRL